MSAPFTLPLQWLRSRIVGRRPGDGTMRALLDGEPFLNQADAVLCWLDSAGALRVTPLADLAQLTSPAFKGTPTAPIAAAGDNSGTVATTGFVARAIAALLNGSSAQLDTLKELADALGDDANFATTMTAALAARLRFDAAQGLTGAQKLQVWQNIGVDGVAQRMNCRLRKASATTLALQPVNGASFVCNGQVYRLNSQPQSIASWQLQPLCCYDVYVDATGSLSPSPFGPSAGNGLVASDLDGYGFPCRQGDPTKTLVGRIAVDGSGALRDDATFRGVWSAYNRQIKPFLNQSGGSTASAAWIALNAPCYAIVNGEDAFKADCMIAASYSTAYDLVSSSVYYNGGIQGVEGWYQAFTNNALGTAVSQNDFVANGLICLQPATKNAAAHSFSFTGYLSGFVQG